MNTKSQEEKVKLIYCVGPNGHPSIWLNDRRIYGQKSQGPWRNVWEKEISVKEILDALHLKV